MGKLKHDHRTNAHSCRSTDTSHQQNNGDRRMTITVFGEEARQIQEGQIFIARKVQIDYGDKVIFEPVVNIDKDGCISLEIRYD